jgi:hypothetical protein
MPCLKLPACANSPFEQPAKGTGMPRDLDEYDYVLPAIRLSGIVKPASIVGGLPPRAGRSAYSNALACNGFYTSSLFKLKKGRILSYTAARPSNWVALMLFRTTRNIVCRYSCCGKVFCIFCWPIRNYRYLYGPVSISKEFSDISKSVIVEFVKRFCFDEGTGRSRAPAQTFPNQNQIGEYPPAG